MSRDVAIIEPVVPSPGASQRPPREITREERRLIIGKLEEVYIDEKRGYSGGWHDERVAKEMGVPRAWVAMLRDENFGPQIADNNPEVQALAERLHTMTSILGDVQRQITDTRAIAERCEVEISKCVGQVAGLQSAIDTARADLRRLTGRG